jgi:uncharacterized membrane protein YuzA (DUF378 family)
MKALHMVTFILLIVGGLNWLLVGLVGTWDLADFVGGTIAQIIYILVGLSAIFEVVTHKKNCKGCGACGDCNTCAVEAPKV